MSYDLTIDVIYDKDEQSHSIYELKPGGRYLLKQKSG